MSATERLRAPSAGNLRDPGTSYPPQPQHQAPHPPGNYRRDNRDLMDKSKSIPNLHVDNSFDGRPDPNQMRPAQSVSALQSQRMPNNVDYYNQPGVVDESRNADYENQPMDPRLRQGEQARGYPSGNQPSPGSRPFVQPQSGTPGMQRGVQNFERPQSQYFDQERRDFIQGRPKSEEFNPEKLRNWHDMDRSQSSSHDQSFENRAPNYSNIRPQPNYANQGEIRKMDMGNQPRQPNFYENTMPRQQEPAPPFQQLRRPPSESEKKAPPTAPKPAITAKPNQPLVQPAEIPRTDVDNRQTQPHFYNPRGQERTSYPGSSPQGYNTSPNSHYQNTSFHDGHADFRMKQSPSQNNYKGSPMNDIPPDLPPPPSMDEINDEDLPPLPPPPTNDYRLEQKIREEQNRLLQQQSDPSYTNLPPLNSRNQPDANSSLIQSNGHRSPQDRQSFSGNQSLPAHSTGYQPPYSAGFQPPHSVGYQPGYPAGYQPQQPHSLPGQPNHDYQNINYPNNSQAPAPQHNQHNVYETYDPQKQQQNYRPPIHKEIKGQREAILSPWDREEREKQQKQLEEDLNRQREIEIAELESRPHLSPQEQDKLRRLKLDYEFNRRLQEVSNRDDDEDSDDDRIMSRRSMQAMQEDLVKSRMRQDELERQRKYEEMEREKERQQRLERRIEMFENEREEQKKRTQKRLEKQQKEQEEYLRKQRDMREQHKREIEEQLRAQKLEEEKIQKRKQAEEQKRKEMERQRMIEIQAKKEAEEAAAREEIRRQEEEYQRQQRAEQERRRKEEEREIRVKEERKRLEASMVHQNQNSYYQQYENLPPQGSPKPMMDPRYGMSSYQPPPPERGPSSYNSGNRNMNARMDDYNNGGYRVNNPSSPFRSSQENIPSKKSVSFNPHVNSQSNMEPEQRSPAVSNMSSSYQPFQRSYKSPDNSYGQTNYSSPASTVPASSNSTNFNNNNIDIQYKTAEGTPTVIGSQEVYRDPRSRIEAKMANKGKQNADRLSFRDKMKFFAQEAGENTPKEKPKASTTQRRIESQILNGQ